MGLKSAMDENAEMAAQIRTWLVDVMERTGLSVTDWAKRAGVARTTIARPIKPGYEFVTSGRTLAKLAAAAHVDAPALSMNAGLTESASGILTPTETKYLIVRHKAQAGYWIETDTMSQQIDGPTYPVAPDPSYKGFDQWLELVVGDSVNQFIAEGSFAHVVSTADMGGYYAKDGDFVVIQRTRDGGHLQERSIKQVCITAENRVEFWPRSTNPIWTQPLQVADQSQGNVTVEVVGLVIGAYRSLR